MTGINLLAVDYSGTCDVHGAEITFCERLMQMLRRGTMLSRSVLACFRLELQTCERARLLAEEMTDELLTEIGYFVDEAGEAATASLAG